MVGLASVELAHRFPKGTKAFGAGKEMDSELRENRV
jgi:hypothetical protein